MALFKLWALNKMSTKSAILLTALVLVILLILAVLIYLIL